MRKKKKILAGGLSFILGLLLNYKHGSASSKRCKSPSTFPPFPSFFFFFSPPLPLNGGEMADYIDIVRSIPPSFYRFASGTKLHHARRNFRRGEKNPLLSRNDRLFLRESIIFTSVGKMKLEWKNEKKKIVYPFTLDIFQIIKSFGRWI